MIYFPFLYWRHFEISRVYQDDPRTTRATEILGVTTWGFLPNCQNQAVLFSSLIMNTRFFQCLFAGEEKSLMITFVTSHCWFTRICAPWFWWHSPRRLVEINVQMILVHSHVDVFLKTSKNYRQLRSENDWQLLIKSCTCRCQLTRGATRWVRSRQNWCTYCPRIFPGLRIPEGNDKYKKPKLLTTSWAIWHRKEWENMKNVDEDVCRLLNKFQNNLVSRTSFISQSFVSNIFSFSPKNLDIWGSIHRQ